MRILAVTTLALVTSTSVYAQQAASGFIIPDHSQSIAQGCTPPAIRDIFGLCNVLPRADPVEGQVPTGGGPEELSEEAQKEAEERAEKIAKAGSESNEAVAVDPSSLPANSANSMQDPATAASEGKVQASMDPTFDATGNLKGFDGTAQRTPDASGTTKQAKAADGTASQTKAAEATADQTKTAQPASQPATPSVLGPLGSIQKAYDSGALHFRRMTDETLALRISNATVDCVPWDRAV